MIYADRNHNCDFRSVRSKPPTCDGEGCWALFAEHYPERIARLVLNMQNQIKRLHFEVSELQEIEKIRNNSLQLTVC